MFVALFGERREAGRAGIMITQYSAKGGVVPMCKVSLGEPQ